MSALSLSVILPNGVEIEFDKTSISNTPRANYEYGIELWDIHAKTVTDLNKIDAIAVEHHLGYIYGNHSMLEMDYIKGTSPIIKRY